MRLRSFVIVAFLALLLAGSAVAQNAYYLAQFATGAFDGGTYRTTFVLFNNTDTDTTAVLQLSDDNGAPVTVTIPGLGSNSQFSISLAAGATRLLQTDGSGAAVTGAGVVTCPIAIGVSAIFSIYDPSGNYRTESGVGSSAPLTEFVLPADTTGLFNTGVALYAGGGDAAVTLILRDTNGQEVQRTSRSLPNHHHLAIYVSGISQLFPTITNFRGTLLVQSSSPIAPVVLRVNSAPLSFTSLPVVPTSSSKTILQLPQVADGFFDTGIYKTSFLIFNISSVTSNVALSLTFPVTIPGQGTGTSFNFTLGPGAAMFLQTDGSGAVAQGAATITSNVPVGASAIFTLFDLQGAFRTEAGVGDSPTLTSMTLPVDIISGQFDTGVAFFNPNASTTVLTFRLLAADGTLTGPDASVALAGMGHLAEYVSQRFPGLGNFRGSLVVKAAPGVAALTLRENRQPLAYTTLPVVSGSATGKVGISPLLSVTQTGITATSNNPDVALNVTLPAGFKLSGTVSGAGLGLRVIANGGANNVFSSAVDSATGNYLIVVPAGTYSLTASYQPSGTPSGASLIMTYADPNSVTISADTTRDILLPSASLFNVSGTVSGVATLPAGLATTIVFTSSDNTRQGQFTLNSNGSFQGVLPSGNYVVCMSDAQIQFAAFQSETLNLYNVGSLVVSAGPATGSFAVPTLATLSGTIRGGGLTSILIGTSATALDTLAPAPALSACCSAPAASFATTDTLGRYQMILAQNRNFSVNVSVLLMQGSALLGTIVNPAVPAGLNLSGNATLDFNLPTLPLTATIFGRVTDSIGGVANVAVSAYSQSITGAANTSFAAAAITDANGNYSITVLSGTNYQLTFTPPVPVR